MDKIKTKTETMAAFHTRPQANSGLKLPLYLPSGEKSEHWVRILGVDSDVFRAAEADARREAFRLVGIDDKAEQAEAMNEAKVRLIAVLVAEWSFPEECTVDNVAAFFKEAPQIMDAIDLTASKRALFSAGQLNSSGPLQNTNSDLT